MENICSGLIWTPVLLYVHGSGLIGPAIICGNLMFFLWKNLQINFCMLYLKSRFFVYVCDHKCELDLNKTLEWCDMNSGLSDFHTFLILLNQWWLLKRVWPEWWSQENVCFSAAVLCKCENSQRKMLCLAICVIAHLSFFGRTNYLSLKSSCVVPG